MSLIIVRKLIRVNLSYINLLTYNINRVPKEYRLGRRDYSNTQITILNQIRKKIKYNKLTILIVINHVS